MKKLILLFLGILTFANAQQPDAKKPERRVRKSDSSLAKITDEPGLPRVLIIGDSISMGYTLPVRELLRGKANLHRIPMNEIGRAHV